MWRLRSPGHVEAIQVHDLAPRGNEVTNKFLLRVCTPVDLGESTQLRGVTPDIVLPSPISQKDVGESVLDNALPWDRISSVPFRAQSPTESLAQTLSSQQSDRAAHNADYQWLLSSLSMLASTSRTRAAVSINC